MLGKAVESCDQCELGRHGPCLFRPKKVAAGTMVAHQGEVSREVLFVKEGVLGLTATDAAGDEVLTSVRGPRSVIGLESLSGKPSPFTVTALDDATVCSLNTTRLSRETGLDTQKTLSSAFLGLVLEEHATALRDADLRAGLSRTRVARFLVAYSKLVKPGRKAAFSKSHVAALLGIRPETLSRSLRQFAEDGLIGNDRLEVLDEAALAEIGRGAR
jgi:CRP/FNR family transcriptional regulator